LGFANVVSTLSFSKDGKWLFSGTSSGIVKVWDTERWAESARLKGCRGEEPSSVLVAPSQRWLVVVQPSCLHVFKCGSPWNLVRSLLPSMGVQDSMLSRWCFAAFSPPKSEHQDHELAALSTTRFSIIDCSEGWSVDAPLRSHSRSSISVERLTGFLYTSCGNWAICSYDDGSFEVWSARPLAREKTFRSHAATYLCALPQRAFCDPYIVSCGLDGYMNVWSSRGWVLEQECIDEKRSAVDSLYCCAFSFGGEWLVSVGTVMNLWRVKVAGGGRIALSLHQRLDCACTLQGQCAAAFCGWTDTLAVSSRDGALGLWTKRAGLPPSPRQVLAKMELLKKKQSDDGNDELAEPYVSKTTEMLMMTRPMKKMGAVSSVAFVPANRWEQTGGQSRPTTPVTVMERLSAKRQSRYCTGIATDLIGKIAPMDADGTMSLQRSCSTPAVAKWTANRFEFGCSQQQSKPRVSSKTIAWPM
jgi:WD40 repeat protein